MYELVKPMCRRSRFSVYVLCLALLPGPGLLLFAQDEPMPDEAGTPDAGLAEEPEQIELDGPVYNTLPVDAEGRPVPLTMEQTVRLVLDNNNLVRIRQLQILQSDTPLLRDEAQYSPVLEGGYQSQDSIVAPEGRTSLFTPARTETDIYYARLKKLFSTGTYFEVEASDTRSFTHYDFTQNANTSSTTSSTSSFTLDSSLFRTRPLHTGALGVVLRQELLKNAFGYGQRRANDINRNLAEIQRQNLIYELTQLVVGTMIRYWQLSIAEENLDTAQELLRNTRNIRAITIQKSTIGLAEAFEVNQWNALAAQAESLVEQARLNRNSERRALLREMNLDPQLELTGATNLLTEVPGGITPEDDLELAYQTRPDFRSIALQRENARKAYELAENRLLPSVTVGGRYSSRDYARHARQSFNDIGDYRSPEYGLEFRVEYPLWDEDARVDARNARIDLRTLDIQEEQLRRQIRDEIYEGVDQINVAYEALNNARTALEQTRAYYNGLVYRYRQGRFTAVAVKQALDSLAQARQSFVEATVNFNISLVRYDLVRNTIFVRYGIEIEDVIDRMRDEQEAFEP
ncbi:MAG: TolC family protein [Leptospiraceae bacterium]|nr:TolC family protein [Leptospiraceae bacterium]